MTENTIITMLAGIIFLMTILLFLFVFIVIQRMREKKSLAYITDYIHKYGDILYLQLIEGDQFSSRIKPINKTEKKAIEKILLHYSKNITDNDILLRIKYFVEANLQNDYRKQLNSRRWSTRMNVLYKIIDFQMEFLVDDVLKMLNSSKKYSADEYFQMYKILSFFRKEEFIGYLSHPKFELAEIDFKKLIFNADTKQLESLIAQFEDLPIALKYSIIDIIGIKNFLDGLPFLERRLVDRDLEIRIRALKANVQLGVIRDLSLYLPFIESSSWEERLMIAKLLMFVPIETSLPYLKKLLKDPSWWVRSQAAKTIKTYKEGETVLETIIETIEDRFAIDMAKEALGKEY